jgi:hypothetical protein
MQLTIMVNEFERLLDRQSSDLKEHMDLRLKPIEEQVKKTNGRVTKNEGDIMAHALWQSGMSSGVKVLIWVAGISGSMLVGYLTWLSLEVLAVPDRIDTAITEAFEASHPVHFSE